MSTTATILQHLVRDSIESTDLAPTSTSVEETKDSDFFTHKLGRHVRIQLKDTQDFVPFLTFDLFNVLFRIYCYRCIVFKVGSYNSSDGN